VLKKKKLSFVPNIIDDRINLKGKLVVNREMAILGFTLHKNLY
jgi:hypothetical protein